MHWLKDYVLLRSLWRERPSMGLIGVYRVLSCDLHHVLLHLCKRTTKYPDHLRFACEQGYYFSGSRLKYFSQYRVLAYSPLFHGMFTLTLGRPIETCNFHRLLLWAEISCISMHEGTKFDRVRVSHDSIQEPLA